MVLKTCKPGYTGLNTGRTLRAVGHLPSRRYAFIRCCASSADTAGVANTAEVRQPASAALTEIAAAIERAQLDFSLRDLSIDLPPDGVEYSLNKRSRWKTAERIGEELRVLAEEADYQVQLFEHHLRPCWGTSGSRACTTFYSSGGAGKSTMSMSASGQRYMNAGSLAKEQESGKSRRRRSQRNRRRNSGADNTEFGTSEEGIFSETDGTGNRRYRIALACDVVRSVPSGSSAVYPARQSKAKRRKLTGRYYDKANDVIDMMSDYLSSDLGFEDRFCSDDESIAGDDGYCQPPSDSAYSVVTVSAALEDWRTGAVLVPADVHTAHTPAADVHTARTPDELTLKGQVHLYKDRERSCKPQSTTLTPSIKVDVSSDSQRPIDVRLIVRQLGGKEMRILHINDGKKNFSRQTSNSHPEQCELDRSKDSADGANAVVALASHTVDLSCVAPLTLRILPRDDGSGVMEQLSSAFGELYSDCRCQPRMCTVELRDISRKVSLACRCRPKHTQLIAHLVVQEEARQSDTYNVWLSANLRAGQSLVGTLEVAEVLTVEELLVNVEAYLLSLPHESFATEPLVSSIHRGAAPSRAITALYDTRRWSVACQTLEDVQQEVSTCIAKLKGANELNAEASQESIALIPALAQRSLPARQTQCGACFEEIGPEQTVKGAALTQCGHSFCFDCWRAYLSGKVTEGKSVLQCPGHRCSSVVDLATILAICGPDMVRRHQLKQAEVAVWKEGNVSWCPNPRCKRLIRVKYERPKAAGHGEAICIRCLCGQSFCLSCRGEPHWPLTCEQATHYHTLLKLKGLFSSEQVVRKSILVHTKPCPGCQYPIEKWKGCHRMMCSRCSAVFCWRCLKVLPESSAYEHVMPCVAPFTDLEEHEFSNATALWSGRSSSLASKALESRRCHASSVARRLKRQLVAVLARVELQTMKEFAELLACSTPSNDSTNPANRVAKHLLRSVVAFKLDAHRIEEYSLACLAMAPRRCRRANAFEPVAAAAAAQEGTSSVAAATSSLTSAADTSRQMTRKRAVAELTRLSFMLVQMEALLLSLSSTDSAKPTLEDLRRLDGFSAMGERNIRSIVILLAAFQDF